MDELQKRSIRILMDMQACQTVGSAHRGVGRYSQALLDHIIAQAGTCDIMSLSSDTLTHRPDFQKVSPSKILHLPALPEWSSGRSFNGGEHDYLDSLALSAFVAPAKADVIHVSHVFEGLGDRVPLPNPALRPQGQIFSATLYDLIPLVFPEVYFQNSEVSRWYNARIAWLRQANLLLAISESSRQDAINFLGIDPSRVVTVYGGIGSHFTPGKDPKFEKAQLTRRYGLRDRFVLYTGGDDHRKNIAGAIEGFAAVSPDTRKDCQLVIVCSMAEHRKKELVEQGRRLGLNTDDIVVTGFVPEEDLVSFYRCCEVFVFPSMYEGLGLPVLEAMACGAPVIGGNNSSIRELIVRPDALFDAKSVKSIGASIQKVLSDNGFASNLRSYGLKRNKDFSWERTAALSIDAFNDTLTRSRTAGVNATIQGWIPRKRVAILSPLPPCRSGIADYNAKFLPYLAEHLDIDLYVNNYKVTDQTLEAVFRIYDVKDFPGVAKSYDAILYEFGNSDFHEHMLTLLREFPGIVGLHDAYLSGLLRYVEHSTSDPGRYAEDMLRAHGPLANTYLAPLTKTTDATDKLEVEFPCTKGILDLATGVISHSVFNLDLARKFFPESWQAPYKIIPQMVPLPSPLPVDERESLRASLGIGPNDLIIASFGHVAWTKWGERLLEAFLSSPLRDNLSVHLIYVGELSKDPFGEQLKKSVAKAKLGNRIQITGFLDEIDYEKYLRAADIAVQLRTNSRGGTPKGVLDCLAYGVPVVVNNEASYTDYPEDVVVKIARSPSPSIIAETLLDLIDNKAKREGIAQKGRAYVAQNHSPARCAAEYAAAIHEFIEREKVLDLNYVSRKFAPHVGGSHNVYATSELVGDWLARIRTPSFGKRRILVDVSHIVRDDHETGIPRVVKRTVQAFYTSQTTGFEPLAVELRDGRLWVAFEWMQKHGIVPASYTRAVNIQEPVTPRSGDVLLMLDSSWHRYREFYPVFEDARAHNVPVYTAIYDLLPITLPPGCIVEGGKEWFQGWVREAVASSDGLVCISKSAANEISDHIKNNLNDLKMPRIGYWHLGADFSDNLTHESETDKAHGRPYMLMVGTIEPRKSYDLALDAFERLWQQGHELGLRIVGKEGWMVKDLVARLRNHPQLGKKLFLHEGATDKQMNGLYRQAAGLLFLSKGEGFGLPLVEAAHYGIPIVCSDIPVFHEIAGDFATYVTLASPEKVAEDIDDWWKNRNKLADTRDMPKLSWEQSGEALLDVVLNNNWIKDN